MIATAPVAIAALPSNVPAAPIAPAAPSPAALADAAADAIMEEHAALHAYAGADRGELADACRRALDAMCQARDAAIAEHGEAARVAWSEALGAYVEVMMADTAS